MTTIMKTYKVFSSGSPPLGLKARGPEKALRVRGELGIDALLGA